MKYALIALVALVPLSSVADQHGQAKPDDQGAKAYREDIIFPKLLVQNLVQMVEGITKMKVDVPNMAELTRSTSLILPAEYDDKMLLAVIEALLALEGLELIESDGQLTLHRFLSREQSEKLKDGLRTPKEDGPPVRLLVPRERRSPPDPKTK